MKLVTPLLLFSPPTSTPTITETETITITETLTETITEIPWSGNFMFYTMKDSAPLSIGPSYELCSSGSFEVFLKRKDSLVFSKQGVTMNFSCGSNMQGGTGKPNLFRGAPEGQPNAITVYAGDTIKVTHRPIGLANACHPSFGTGSPINKTLTSIEMGEVLTGGTQYVTIIYGWDAEDVVSTKDSSTLPVTEYEYTFQENDEDYKLTWLGNMFLS